MFADAEVANTGTISPDMKPDLSPAVSSSFDSSSPSRYFSVRSSSVSATASTSCSYASGSTAGLSSSDVTPLKDDAAPSGTWAGTHFRPHSSTNSSTTSSNDVLSRSSLFTMMARGSSNSSHNCHACRAPTSMPAAAEITITAASDTLSADIISPLKSG